MFSVHWFALVVRWHKSLAVVRLASVAARLRWSGLEPKLWRSWLDPRLWRSGLLTPGSRGLGLSQGSGGLGLSPGSGSLSSHGGQLSAYLEINISGSHRASACVLLNLWQAIRTGFKGAQTSVWVSVGITDEAVTISSACWTQRNPTYRPSS